MKTEDAIRHLKWKFTKSGIKSSKLDKESLNAIILALNQQSVSELNDNLNFCKLFIYTFKKMCFTNAVSNNYKEIDIKMIYYKLQTILRMDANSHIDSLYQELKGIEIQKLINNNNLNYKTLSSLTTKKEVNSATRKMLNEFIKNN